MKKKWIDLILFCLLSVCSKAQIEGYHYYSNIDSITSSGFYRFALEPKLNAHIKTDFSDIRIVNNAGKWVPHVLSAPVDGDKRILLSDEILFEKTGNSPTNTELILEAGGFLDAFDIRVKSTSANRVARLSGSDDRLNWFVILDSFLLTPRAAENKGETTYRVDFLASNYKYYKLVIDNRANDPVNILAITSPVSVAREQVGFAFNNPKGEVVQMDSGRISYIKIVQPENYHIDHLTLTVSGVKYYYRKLEIYLPTSENHSFSDPGALLKSFYISNNSISEFTLPPVNPRVFYVLIHNEDNLPLKVYAIKSGSDTRYLTAYLEKGGEYKLVMDNPAASMPDYDLTRLKYIIPDSTQFLATGNLTAFEQKKSASSPEKNNKWMLWIAIAAAIIILLFFTSKMLKEIDKRKSV